MKDAKVSAQIIFDSSDEILSYAAEELKKFLSSTGEITFGDGNLCKTIKLLQFNLGVSSSMPSSCFSVSCKENSNIMEIELLGADPPCTVNSVYTLLERLGFLFDVTGPINPKKLDIESLAGWKLDICPAVKFRGIRQHINFPMDISSYPLAEAKEYIRNLARMRFNCITFHSYPEQWYQCKLSKKRMLAGKFFYNQTHIVPEYAVVKNVTRNEKYFCIPEIEPVFDQHEKRSMAAVMWLQELMKEARKVGLKVQFSVELRDESQEDSVKICQAIIGLYPMIDLLELITQECGGSWGSSNLTVDETKNQLKKIFGDGILQDKKIMELITDGLGQLPLTLQEMSNQLNVVRELKRQMKESKCTELAVGVYATEPDTLEIMLNIMRKYAPDDVKFTFLPAHGSRAVVNSVRSINFTDEDLKRTMLYSWIEFDGSMYVQQNSICGIQQLIEYQLKVLKNPQIHGLCFNHWRTAENRTTIRYAALACLYGHITQEDFYNQYSVCLGIGSGEKYTKAMLLLDCAETNVRNRLGNIGFCFEPCLWNSGLGIFANYDTAVLNEVKSEYLNVSKLLMECFNATAAVEAENYLKFLINRIDCTVLHLGTAIAITRLQAICKVAEPDKLTEDEKAVISKQCDLALSKACEYMKFHAKMIIDRGCEGTLISYYHTIPVVINKIKAFYNGMNKACCMDIRSGGSDAPPPPAI